MPVVFLSKKRGSPWVGEFGVAACWIRQDFFVPTHAYNTIQETENTWETFCETVKKSKMYPSNNIMTLQFFFQTLSV